MELLEEKIGSLGLYKRLTSEPYPAVSDLIPEIFVDHIGISTFSRTPHPNLGLILGTAKLGDYPVSITAISRLNKDEQRAYFRRLMEEANQRAAAEAKGDTDLENFLKKEYSLEAQRRMKPDMLNHEDYQAAIDFAKQQAAFSRRELIPKIHISFIQTQGASPLYDGTGPAIAHTIQEFYELPMRQIVVTLMGGSGGGLLGHGDIWNIMEDGFKTVIDIDSYAAILFPGEEVTDEHRRIAAESLRATPKYLSEMGLVDNVIPVPRDSLESLSAEEIRKTYATNIRDTLIENTKDLLEHRLYTWWGRREERVLRRGLPPGPEGWIPGAKGAVEKFIEEHHSAAERIARYMQDHGHNLPPSFLNKMPALIKRRRSPKTKVIVNGGTELAVDRPEALKGSANVKCEPIRGGKPEDDIEGLYCGATIDFQVYEQNFRACPHCGFGKELLSVDMILEMAVDEGTFHELDSNLVLTDLNNLIDSEAYREKRDRWVDKTEYNESLVTGIGKIMDYPAAFVISNIDYSGGAMGLVAGEKIVRLFKYAEREGLPVINFSQSGGAQIQEGTVALEQMLRTVAAVSHFKKGRLSERIPKLYDHGLTKQITSSPEAIQKFLAEQARKDSVAGYKKEITQEENSLPYISVLLNPTTGGVQASYSMLGDIIIAEPKAFIWFAGPRVIAQAGMESLVDYRTARSEHFLDSGIIDEITPRTGMRRSLMMKLKQHAGTDSEYMKTCEKSFNDRRIEERRQLPWTER